MKNLIFILSFATLIGLASCEKNDDVSIPVPEEAADQENESSLKSKQYLSFNRTRAVNYALDHTVCGIDAYGNKTGEEMTHTNYNLDDYEVFTPNDCANFVSQALKAGGVSFKYGSNPFNKWYYDDSKSPKWSKTWINAQDQFRFFRNNYAISQKTMYGNQIDGSASNVRNSSAYQSLISSLYEGDLIYFDHTNDGGHDHVMMVTDVQSGTVAVSGHTYNQLNNDLASVIWGNKFYIDDNDNVITYQPNVRILAVSFQ